MCFFSPLVPGARVRVRLRRRLLRVRAALPIRGSQNVEQVREGVLDFEVRAADQRPVIPRLPRQPVQTDLQLPQRQAPAVQVQQIPLALIEISFDFLVKLTDERQQGQRFPEPPALPMASMKSLIRSVSPLATALNRTHWTGSSSSRSMFTIILSP